MLILLFLSLLFVSILLLITGGGHRRLERNPPRGCFPPRRMRFRPRALDRRRRRTTFPRRRQRERQRKCTQTRRSTTNKRNRHKCETNDDESRITKARRESDFWRSHERKQQREKNARRNKEDNKEDKDFKRKSIRFISFVVSILGLCNTFLRPRV